MKHLVLVTDRDYDLNVDVMVLAYERAEQGLDPFPATNPFEEYFDFTHMLDEVQEVKRARGEIEDLEAMLYPYGMTYEQAIGQYGTITQNINAALDAVGDGPIRGAVVRPLNIALMLLKMAPVGYDALIGLVSEFATVDPYDDIIGDHGEERLCRFCGVSAPVPDPVLHSPACVWHRARQREGR